MTSDSIPSNCKECAHARENAYTKGWYCEVSGAPLGSKRAQDFCPTPKASTAAASSAGSPTASQPSGSSPEAPKEATSESPGPQQQEAKDGADAPKQASNGASAEEELVYGYPFDVM